MPLSRHDIPKGDPLPHIESVTCACDPIPDFIDRRTGERLQFPIWRHRAHFAVHMHRVGRDTPYGAPA